MQTYKHIICAVDFSTASEKALQQAIYLSDATDTKLTLVHFIEPMIKPSYDYVTDCSTIENEILACNEEKMQQLVAKYQLENVETLVSIEPARLGIKRIVEEKEPDLLVMGRYGHHHLLEHIMGSTTHYVLNHLKCNLLVTQE